MVIVRKTNIYIYIQKQINCNLYFVDQLHIAWHQVVALLNWKMVMKLFATAMVKFIKLSETVPTIIFEYVIFFIRNKVYKRKFNNRMFKNISRKGNSLD